MYDETAYEEYMRNVLGYMPTYPSQNVYEPNDYYIMQPRNQMNVAYNKCEELYPEIYHKVYPLVCNECKNMNTEITNETLEDRQVGARNNFLRDLIRILILKEIIGGGNRPRPPMPPHPPRPPFPGGPGGRPPFPPPHPREF